MALTLSTSAFGEGETIPVQYTCDGENISPPLSISDVPDGTQSLALIVIDPDVPKEVREDQMFYHWIVYNIPSETTDLEQNTIPSAAILGSNSSGGLEYSGPCPPPQYEPTEHRYFFRLYALDTELSLPEGAEHEDVEAAMNGSIIEQAELMGRYARS